MTDILLLGFIFLVAGVISVPVATRLGLGSVLGYLLAGIAISPLLNAIHVDVIAIQHFAEFGVVMMLFLVGLELEPHKLIAMRTRLLGLGGLQVGITTAVVAAIAFALGQVWSIALTIGLIFALSSTAIVLQTLNEKGLMRSDGGQSSFSVLLFQDIAVIPMLALIPLLALPELIEMANVSGDHAEEGHGININLVAGLPGWQQALATVTAVGAVFVGGRYLIRPLFRYIAMAGLREIFVAAALMMVIGIALLMMVVGLSPALGTFLAGVVLANSEYRHELESDIEPFKGLLLGLFFITVGASINFTLLGSDLPFYIGATISVMFLKGLVLLGLSFIFSVKGSDRWLMVLGLAQAGEFGFVLLSFAQANHVLPATLTEQLLLIVALSMLLTPALFIFHDKVIASRFSTKSSAAHDEHIERGKVIIAGHGRMGGIVNRILKGVGYDTTVVDFSSEQLEMLRQFGITVFFGDATRPDLLEAAGIEDASMVIVAIDDREHINTLVHYLVHNHPHVEVVARARDRQHVYELWSLGCRQVIRETFDSSVRMGRSALEVLGVHPFEAERLTRQFVVQDRKNIRRLADVYDLEKPMEENQEYIELSRESIAEIEAELTNDVRSFSHRAERGWQPPSLDDIAAEDRPDAK